MTRYEPINLHLELILPNNEKKYLDLYGYVVSYLYSTRFSDNRWKELHKTGKNSRKRLYIPLNSKVLRRIIGTRHATRILQNLVRWKIIQCNNHYVPGKKSIGYRLTPTYSDEDFKGYAYSPRFAEKVKRVSREEMRKRLSPLQLEIATQIEREFYLDTEFARFILNSLEVDPLTRNRMKLMMDRLSQCDFGHSSSKETKRYFNLLMNLKRELREAIVYKKGKTLDEVDIANSQPYFLTFLISALQTDREDIGSLIQDVGLDKEQFRSFIGDNSFGDFNDLTINGWLYDFLCKETGLMREEVKEETLRTFFKRLNYRTEFENQFDRLFPSVHKVLTAIKRMRGYNRCAILLQRLESHVVLERLGARLLSEGIPFVPIHDSVIVPHEDAPYVKRILENICEELCGFRPTVKIKPNHQQRRIAI